MEKKNKKDLDYYNDLPYNIILETWDDGRGTYYVARVAELPHCIIHGDTLEEAVGEIQSVKREWIESNLKRGNTIPEPVNKKYSGRISLRIPPSLHRLLANSSMVQDVSLNQYMTMALANFAGLQTPELMNKESSSAAAHQPGRRRKRA